MPKKYLIAFAFLSQAFFGFSQSERYIDSLQQAIKLEKVDTIRCQKLIYAGTYLMYSQPEEALKYARQAVEIARKSNYTKGEGEALQLIGGIFTMKGNSVYGLDYFLQGLRKIEEGGTAVEIGEALSLVGYAYYRQGDYKKYLEYMHKALKIAQRANSDYLKFFTIANIGDGYERMDQLDSAAYYVSLAQQITSEMKYKVNVALLNNITGNIYRKRGKFSLALEYYRQSAPFLETNKIDEPLIETYLGMSKSFYGLNQIDSALHYSKKALKISQNGAFTQESLKRASSLPITT